MLVKFFKNKSGGSIAGINYLLNHRVKDKTAFVLKGSEAVTRQIVSNMTKKQKLCMGCLSFEETDIDLDTKRKIIDEFETLLLGGYKERFNVLWVQHVDKGRLELNFAIPKIDIESSMAFNPYYDKVDRPLIDTWQNYVNLKFGFTDPKDPIKAHMLQGSRKEIGVIKNYIELEKILTEKFINQEFSCRDDILKALRDSSIEVSRVGKDYISIKLPNTKKAKRFKGDMFSEEFRDFESLDKLRSKAEARAAEFANTRNAKRDIKEERRVDAFPDRNCRTDGFSKNGTSKEIQGGEGGAETKLSPRDQELERLTRELNRQIQKRNKWLEIQADRVPKRGKYIQNNIDDLDECSDTNIGICMETASAKGRSSTGKSTDDDVYKTEYRWREINHKHTIFNERIFENDFIRANIIGSIRRKREARARLDSAIKTTIDGIRLVKQRVSQVANTINKPYKFFVSRIRKFTNAASELAERIQKSDFFTREIPNATREFEEVVRKYGLSSMPEDIKIDVNKIKVEKIEEVGIYDDVGL